MTALDPQPQAGLGSQAGWWRPAWRTQAQSLLPARAGATPSRHDRSGRPGPHQVPDASCFGARVLPTAPLHHRLAGTPPVVCAPPESPHCPPSPPEWDPGHQRPHDAAPTAEGGGCGAWQTMWFPSESPFTQNADFNREQFARRVLGCGRGRGRGPRGRGLRRLRPAVALARRILAAQPGRLPGLQLRGPPCSRPPEA